MKKYKLLLTVVPLMACFSSCSINRTLADDGSNMSINGTDGGDNTQVSGPEGGDFNPTTPKVKVTFKALIKDGGTKVLEFDKGSKLSAFSDDGGKIFSRYKLNKLYSDEACSEEFDLNQTINEDKTVYGTFYRLVGDVTELETYLPEEKYVLLDNDINLPYTDTEHGFVLKDNAIFDLGGHTISCSSSSSRNVCNAYCCYTGVNITIQNGKFNSTTTYENSANFAFEVGKRNVESSDWITERNTNVVNLRNLTFNSTVAVYYSKVNIYDCKVTNAYAMSSVVSFSHADCNIYSGSFVRDANESNNYGSASVFATNARPAMQNPVSTMKIFGGKYKLGWVGSNAKVQDGYEISEDADADGYYDVHPVE